MTTFIKTALVATFSMFAFAAFAQQTAAPSTATPTAELSTPIDELPTLPQFDIAKYTIFAEAGSNGSLYSVNYDQILFATPRLKVSAQIGVGTSKNAFKGDVDPFIPLGFNVLLGAKKHHIETGIGAMAAFGFDETDFRLNNLEENTSNTTPAHGGGNSEEVQPTTSSNGVTVWQVQVARENVSFFTTAKIGYRYQRPEGGLFVRAAASPIINVYNKSGKIDPSIGFNVGVGYTFKSKKAGVPLFN